MRRRKRRYLWLPAQGIAGAAAENPTLNGLYGGDFFDINIPNDGTVVTVTRDITFDQPPEETNTGAINVNTPMAVFLRSAYMLRRVVGHLFASIFNIDPGADDINACIATYGMLVARADEADPTRPVLAATNGERTVNYSPQHVDNLVEPYIFQRTWVLGNAQRRTAAPGVNGVQFPSTNAQYGSAREGTHLDAKTMRRVDGDNRLWHVVSVRTYPVGTVSTTSTTRFSLTTQLRLLGRATPLRRQGSF